MFRGLYEHTIDSKGRSAVPRRFREVLVDLETKSGVVAPAPERVSARESEESPEIESTVIITTSIDHCLVVYPLNVWREFEERLAALPQFDPSIVQLKRIYVASATECNIDKTGRLLIPPVLRNYAQLKKEIVWTGMVRTVEIWAQDIWDQQLEEARVQARMERGKIAEAIRNLGL